MVKKLDCLKSGERGEELKVPYHISTAAVCDGNLPQLAPNNGHLPLFPIVRTAVFKYINSSIVKVKYVSTLVYSVYYIFNILISLYSKLLLCVGYVTQLPLILWFYWLNQFHLLRTDSNLIQVLF